MNTMVMVLAMILSGRLRGRFKVYDRKTMMMDSSIMTAPPSIRYGMGVSPAVLASVCAVPGMKSERISAFNMLSMTTIHKMERRVWVSIWLEKKVLDGLEGAVCIVYLLCSFAGACLARYTCLRGGLSSSDVMSDVIILRGGFCRRQSFPFSSRNLK